MPDSIKVVLNQNLQKNHSDITTQNVDKLHYLTIPREDPVLRLPYCTSSGVTLPGTPRQCDPVPLRLCIVGEGPLNLIRCTLEVLQRQGEWGFGRG